jgi:hypothetical protein
LDAKPIVLKVLLQHRHLQTHRAFCREYDKVAAKADPTSRGGWPSKAQFYRWLSGELVGLPYPDHCRILESMFPGWKVDQLFQMHEGGIDFIPEPDNLQKLRRPPNRLSRPDQLSKKIPLLPTCWTPSNEVSRRPLTDTPDGGRSQKLARLLRQPSPFPSP